MEELPKFVQHRLATATPDAHPDANLLGAFAENSLAPHERTQLLQHLAECSVCRDTVALAQPQEEEEVVALSIAASAAPLAPAARRLNLRWGALAACAIMVAGAVWTMRRPQKAAVAVLPTGSFSAAIPEEQLPPAKLTAKLEDQAKNLPASRIAELRATEKPASKSRDMRRPESKLKMHGGIEISAAPAPPTSQPLERAENEVAQNAQALPASPKADEKDSPLLAGGAAPATGATLPERERNEKAKMSEAAAFSKVGAAADSGLVSTRLNAFDRWTLADGKLRNSTDAGVNWKIVPFEQEVNFRALSVLGDDIWVGGKKGVVYHSVDNGVHWLHVVPTVEGESLSEDVVRLEFSDALHGKLVTPHSEWSTSNGGVTWQKKAIR